MAEGESIRVLVADDHALYRRGLEMVLGAEEGIEIVGEAGDGAEAIRRVEELLPDVVLMDIRMPRRSGIEACTAIKDVFDDTRSILEPSGALAVAGLRRWVTETNTTGERLAAVLSGANMNFDRLRFVAERAELGESREVLLAVTIPERPGAFRNFCTVVGRRVVTEFNYRLHGRAEAHIFVGISTASREDATALTRDLTAAGYTVVDLSGNELAKLHVRHMVGGRSADVAHEQICRFEFPERPGALMTFLDELGGRWNISLFHYRNHGSDFGRVLAGFEVPPAEMPEFEQFLVDLGYRHERERGNPAYELFLG